MRPLNISFEDAKKYYHEKDPFFNKYGNSKWYGKGCKEFNLSSEIKRKDFLNLLEGRSPIDSSKIVKINKGRKNRCCIDIPMSAPKSVSIAALILQDYDLIAAHTNAVKKTIKYIEEKYIYTRETTNKKTKLTKNNKAIFATFKHSTNRADDPHMHTHVLTMNLVKTKRGFKSLCNDYIFKDQSLITAVYQSFLKEKVLKLGYNVKEKTNGWDIDGIDNEIIKLFSKRRFKIKNEKGEIKSLNLLISNYKSDRISFLKTRKDKNYDITHKELLELWNKQTNVEDLIKNIKKESEVSTHIIKNLTLKEKLNLVTNILHENEATFDKNKLLRVIMKSCNVNVIKAEKMLEEGLKQKTLVHIDTKIYKGLEIKIYSTPKMVEAEEKILKHFTEGKGKVQSFCEKNLVDGAINKDFKWLTKDQKNAVQYTLLNNDQFSIIQGDAGTGKTACMEAVKNITNKQILHILSDISKNTSKSKIAKLKTILDKHIIKGMGFTGKSAVELEMGSKIKSSTIDSFLLSKENIKSECIKEGINYNEIKSRIFSIWLVDESSMIGSLQMKKILNRANKEKAKTIFVGDAKQLRAISAGKMFSELQKIDAVNTINMGHNLRQKTSYMKQTVGLLKEYMKDKNEADLSKAFSLLEKNKSINNIKTEEIHQQVAQEYAKSYRKEQTLILCGDNKTKEITNDTVRELLKSKKEIGNNEISIKCREPLTIKGHKKYFAHYYPKMCKAFISASKNGESIKGKEVYLESIDERSNTINFKFSDGKLVNINPMDQIDEEIKISLYHEQQKKFSVGDKVIFRKNDKLLNIQNGLTAKVKNTSDKKLILKTEKGRIICITEKLYPYIDYDYAVTTHKSQGQTCDKVLYVATQENELMNRTQNLYVGLTRAKKDVQIYTNNYDNVKLHFLKEQEKTSTLEINRTNERSL